MGQQTLRKWGIGLLGAALNGAASAVTVVIVDPLDFDPFNGGLRKLAIVAGTMGAIGAALYIKQHELPAGDD